jgi:sulfur-oxidizing protein SoxZ
MATPKPKVRLPKKVAPGEIIEIKTLISHEMESGQRKDKDGNLIPRRIINKFEVKLDGQPVFTTVIYPAISANPYLSFFLKAEKTGELEMTWTDDDGSVYVDKQTLTVG